VVGADNIGAATAQRFASEGYGVALLRRTPTKSKEVVDEINKTGQGRAIAIAADITNPTAVAEAFAEIKKELGKPNALVYNATALKKGSVASTSVEDFVECWQTNCLGAFLCAKQALDSMGDGTMIFTGSADGLRGAGDTATLTVGKAGLRALAQSVARENKGIHVAHVILNGSVGGIAGGVGFLTSKLGVDTALTPSAVADEYWHLHTQNPSTWTFELDLRPRMEAFD